MPRGIGRNTDGVKISLYANYYRPFFGDLGHDRRPRIEIRGQWQGDSIVGDDYGSISRSFNPDGTVDHRTAPHQPYPGLIVPVTLNAGSYSEFKSACQANR